MSIKQRGSSFEASLIHSGKRYRRSFRDQAEAIRWEAEARLAILENRQPDMGSLARVAEGQPRTLGELRDYVERRHWAGTRSERTTMINADNVVEILGADLDIRKIDETHVDCLVFELERKGNANATVNRKLAVLSKMMRIAAERGWVNRKPRIERKRESEHRIICLTRDEEEQVIRFTRHVGKAAHADLWEVLVDTGMRCGEALKLRWSDIDWDARTITTQSKNGDVRSIPMTDRALDTLTRRRTMGGSGPWVHLTQSSVNHVWNLVRSHMNRHNDEQFVPHALRHTFASRLARSGVPIATIKALCGHKTISITMRYAHLAPHNLTDAIQVLNSGGPRLRIA